jgi:hypothetical protein
MNMTNLWIPMLFWVSAKICFSQVSDAAKDSLFIQQIEDQLEPDKVLHAEPLYIDLIRDLGARKGEKEWNLGLGLSDNRTFDSYEALIEYEWAPINRLGLEVELPFTFYSAGAEISKDSVPSNRLNSLKLAAQWSFFVNEELATSMAIGYIHEFELSGFRNFGKPLIWGNVYNPFLVVAKRWGNNFHSLLYSGPRIEHHFSTNSLQLSYEFHTSFHYMITGTRNFVGVEWNKMLTNNQFNITMRPQMRLGIAKHLMVGIVAGIPIGSRNEGLSAFIRLIWEPGHRKK